MGPPRCVAAALRLTRRFTAKPNVTLTVAAAGEVASTVDLVTAGVPQPGGVSEVVPPRRNHQHAPVRNRRHGWRQLVRTSHYRPRVAHRGSSGSKSSRDSSSAARTDGVEAVHLLEYVDRNCPTRPAPSRCQPTWPRAGGRPADPDCCRPRRACGARSPPRRWCPGRSSRPRPAQQPAWGRARRAWPTRHRARRPARSPPPPTAARTTLSRLGQVAAHAATPAPAGLTAIGPARQRSGPVGARSRP